MSEAKSAILADFLNILERSEASLLTWGLVDGFATEQEVLDRAEVFLEDGRVWDVFPDGLSLLDEMFGRGLLFRWNAPGGRRYRTRFAEGVRLLARLRQLFPQHLRQPGAWLTSPTLVADFRLILRPREYPSRNRPAADAIATWTAASTELTSLQADVLRTLLGATDGNAGTSLAGFQVNATNRILSMAGGSTAAGSIICAATGTGKTLAFYLPAMTHLAGMIERDASRWTRALALYPRNELLKDQFTETCRMAKKVNAVLRANHRRSLRIGALFGSTPNEPAQVQQHDWSGKWTAGTGGYFCPFLQCPSDDCSGQMLWKEEERLVGKERLVCQQCGTTVSEDEIVLTRRRLRQEPPDILFTTTEMLNRRMTDSRLWHLFGVGTPAAKKPALLLLDEVHTYSGPHGAQVAYLLRRWRHRAACSPHFVGLSATLLEATRFFAQLTGLPETTVEEVSPEPMEMLQEGAEYLVAVRGDPISGASLLSTTIQAVMLIRRVLDPKDRATSHGSYGKKVFVFTDDLDVTNRLYFNVLDAEGLDSRGFPDNQRHPQGSLASLRDSTRPEQQRRFLYGQSWDLCETIGHSLRGDIHLRLGRVSSQDAGVDAEAEIIIATAALEVGFNDAEVGAVLQHKAPHEAATFLQRKGRAGRRREVRPWTVVILSDYGRDRLAYQGYDLLFDPELRPRDLPLGNRHVLKMQAVYACLDWLSEQLWSSPAGHLWEDASGPWSALDPGPWRDNVSERQRNAVRLLEDALAGGDGLEKLREWLRRALGLVDADAVSSLLWEPPRALLTAVLPTLLRRLDTGWLSGDVQGGEYRVPHHPLPEFIPATLFSDLNLPEITIRAVVRPGEQARLFPLPVTQALREFAPGRISRRFGVWHRLTRHWLPVDPGGVAPQGVEISSFCGSQDREDLGTFPYRDNDGRPATIRVFRPFALDVRGDAPREIADSSNASLDWRTQLLPPRGLDPGLAVDLPNHSPWRGVIEEIRFFTHFQHQPAHVRRFALGSRADVPFAQGGGVQVTSRFVLEKEGFRVPVALGFAFETDALRVRLRFPNDWKLAGGSSFSAKLPALRAAYFRWRIVSHERLSDVANVFERQWIAEIVLAALTAAAVGSQQTVEQAWASLRFGETPITLPSVLDVIFQSFLVDEEAADDAGDRFEQRRQTQLRQLLGHEALQPVLDEVVPVLWEEPNDSWTPWLQQKFVSTLAAAFRDAIQQLCPDVDVDDLVVDLDVGLADSGNEVPFSPGNCADFWVSETAPGGGGVIERLLPRLAEEPRRFFDLLLSELGESDFETADRELTRFLDWITAGEDAELDALVVSVRTASSQAVLSRAFQDLRGALKRRGMHTSHAVVAALSARLLRPGSTSDTDVLVRDTLRRWTDEEVRLGIEIEARALAYALSISDALDRALGRALPLGPGQDRRQWRFSTLYGLLWPRGTHARNHALVLRNPYAEILSSERLLVLDAIATAESEVMFETTGWREQLEQALVQDGRSVLSSTRTALPEFHRAILRLLTTPIDTDSLLLYPRIRAVMADGGRSRVSLELVAPGQITTLGVASGALATGRLIVKTARGSRDEVRDLLESLFAIELLAPGEEIWLVSPWVTDLPLLDNRAGAYGGLEPSWPKRYITLAELLAFALKSAPHCRVRVVTRPDLHNKRFCRRLRNLVELDSNGDRLVVQDDRQNLHTKGLAGESFALRGSMNFTYNGVEVLEEAVELETDLQTVATLRLNFGFHYPSPVGS